MADNFIEFSVHLGLTKECHLHLITFGKDVKLATKASFKRFNASPLDNFVIHIDNNNHLKH
jgi:hypothetical protein